MRLGSCKVSKVIKRVFLIKRIDSNWVKFVHRHLNLRAKMNLLNRDANLPPGLQHEDDVGLVEQALDVNLVHPHARHLSGFLIDYMHRWDLDQYPG